MSAERMSDEEFRQRCMWWTDADSRLVRHEADRARSAESSLSADLERARQERDGARALQAETEGRYNALRLAKGCDCSMRAPTYPTCRSTLHLPDCPWFALSEAKAENERLDALVHSLQTDVVFRVEEATRALTAERDAAVRERDEARTKRDDDLSALLEEMHEIANAAGVATTAPISPSVHEVFSAPDRLRLLVKALAESRAAHAEAEKQRDEMSKLADNMADSLASTQRQLEEALGALDVAIKKCRACDGRGKRRTSCSMCHDSTWDHLCDDEDVECETCKPLRAFRSRTPSQPSAAKEQGARCGHGDCKTDCGYGR